MRNAARIVLLLALTAFASLSSSATAEKSNLSTPEAALASFVSAYADKDFSKAHACLSTPADPSVLRNLERLAREEKAVPNGLKLVKAQAEITADAAVVKATVAIDVPLGPPTVDETVRLRREAGDWKIVPVTRAELAVMMSQRPNPPRVLPLLVGFCAYPDAFLSARAAARQAGCQTNMKILSLAMLLFLEDHNDKFAMRTDTFRTLLLPALKGDARAFHCNADAEGADSYAFNSALQGRPVYAFPKIQETVMLYEGKDGVLQFKHDGKAAVVFLDGKVAFVDAVAAKKLRWK